MTNQISICIIGKNEETHIENCLSALSNLNVPIIYTDTGSTDNTISIAQKYTDQIYHFIWQNDFSKARNFCAQKANTDWIWVVDCDEYLVSANLDSIQSFCSNVDFNSSAYAGMILQKDSFLSGKERSFANTRLSRIYNKRYCHYLGSIHEQIVAIDSTQTLQYHDVEAVLVHHSYSDETKAVQKAERNINLLKDEINKGADPYIYYQLGKAYQSIQKMEAAANAYEKGLSFDLDPSLQYVQSMVESYGYVLLDLERLEDALSFTSIYDSFNKRADFVFLMGLIYMKNAKFNEAIKEFQKATTFSSCIVEGVNSYKAYYNIGVIYECLGKKDEALSYYQKCISYPAAKQRIDALQP